MGLVVSTHERSVTEAGRTCSNPAKPWVQMSGMRSGPVLVRPGSLFREIGRHPQWAGAALTSPWVRYRTCLAKQRIAILGGALEVVVPAADYFTAISIRPAGNAVRSTCGGGGHRSGRVRTARRVRPDRTARVGASACSASVTVTRSASTGRSTDCHTTPVTRSTASSRSSCSPSGGRTPPGRPARAGQAHPQPDGQHHQRERPAERGLPQPRECAVSTTSAVSTGATSMTCTRDRQRPEGLHDVRGVVAGGGVGGEAPVLAEQRRRRHLADALGQRDSGSTSAPPTTVASSTVNAAGSRRPSVRAHCRWIGTAARSADRSSCPSAGSR